MTKFRFACEKADDLDFLKRQLAYLQRVGQEEPPANADEKLRRRYSRRYHRAIEKDFRYRALLAGPQTSFWGLECFCRRGTNEWRKIVKELVEALKKISVTEVGYIHARIEPTNWKGELFSPSLFYELGGFRYHPAVGDEKTYITPTGYQLMMARRARERQQQEAANTY